MIGSKLSTKTAMNPQAIKGRRTAVSRTELEQSKGRSQLKVAVVSLLAFYYIIKGLSPQIVLIH